MLDCFVLLRAQDVDAATNALSLLEDHQAVRMLRQHLHCGRLDEARKMLAELGRSLHTHGGKQCLKQILSLSEEVALLGHFDLAKNVSSLAWYRNTIPAAYLKRLSTFAFLHRWIGAPEASTYDGKYSTGEETALVSHLAECLAFFYFPFQRQF